MFTIFGQAHMALARLFECIILKRGTTWDNNSVYEFSFENRILKWLENGRISHCEAVSLVPLFSPRRDVSNGANFTIPS